MEALPEQLDVTVARSLAATFGNRSKETRANLADNVAHALAPAGERPDEGLVEEFVERGFRSYGQYWAEGAKLPAIARVDHRQSLRHRRGARASLRVQRAAVGAPSSPCPTLARGSGAERTCTPSIWR